MLHENPIIASVKDEDGLAAALDTECRIVELLFGSLLTVETIVGKLRSAGKTVLVDVDLLDGLAPRDTSVAYLRQRLDITGILSSKAALIKAAKAHGLVGVHRAFMIDSFSYRSLPRQLNQSRADYVEILPGCVPRVIGWLRDDTDRPIIAGGLMCEKADVVAALGAGAVAIATSNCDIWAM